MLPSTLAFSPTGSTGSTHSNLLSASAHRRIELQSPADFTHLVAIATANAREKIAKHIQSQSRLQQSTNAEHSAATPSETIDSTLLTAQLASFLDTTFTSLRHNVSVNGVDGEIVFPITPSLLNPTSDPAEEAEASTHPEDYEPYDAALAARIAALNATVEKMNLTLADTRRGAASKAAAKWKRTFEERLMDDEAEAQAEVVQEEAVDLKVRELVPFFGDGEDAPGRVEDVSRIWAGALDALIRVQGDHADDIRKRAERAEAAVAYLDG